MKSAGHSISLSGVLVALICFFLPWVTVSCGNQVTTLSGTQMALGGTMQTSQGPQQRNPDVFILAVLVAGVAILVILLLALRAPAMPRGSTYATIGLSIVALLILAGRFATQQTDTSGDVDVFVDYHAGFFGTMLGYAMALLGAVVEAVWRARRRGAPGSG